MESDEDVPRRRKASSAKPDMWSTLTMIQEEIEQRLGLTSKGLEKLKKVKSVFVQRNPLS